MESLTDEETAHCLCAAGQSDASTGISEEEKDRLRAAMEDKHRKERQANES